MSTILEKTVVNDDGLTFSREVRAVIVDGLETLTATIANGGSLSAAVALGTTRLVGIITPAAFTTTTILTFDVSADGVTYAPLFLPDNTEAQVILSLSASRYIPVDPTIFNLPYIKIRAGLNGAAVAQGADRVFTLVGRA